jgi:hypothetical protein
MAVKAESFQHRKDPVEDVEDVVPLIVPMSMWEILILQGEIENCAPGEVLDRALCQYLEANGGERMKDLKVRMEKGQLVAQNGRKGSW